MERYCTICGKITAKKNESLFVCQAGHENWINPAIGSSVFVVDGDMVLYGVRSNNPGKGKLDLPGGFIEVGETAEQAAIREAKEELGIDIALIDFLGTYTDTYNGRPCLNLSFIAKSVGGKVVAGDDMGGGDPVWRHVDNLPSSDQQAAKWFDVAQQDFVEWWRARMR